MKCVILAGGLGTRISEESILKPKPMIEIGGKPILWHVMKIYSAYGISDFIICLGYKGYAIKEYFANYIVHMSNVTIDLRDNSLQVHENFAEPWRVTLVDTGEATQTGGRLKRVVPHIGDSEFCFTYGDGVADIDIGALLAFHRKSQATVTLTAVQPPGRFGSLALEEGLVTNFLEKPRGDGGWINGGFFVCSSSAIDLISGDDTVWENQPLQQLAQDRRLSAYCHKGFWHPMDTLRDKNYLEDLWARGQAPWKIW